MNMTSTLKAASVLALAVSSMACASRTAPFDDLDQAQVTILKLQQPAAVAPIPGAPTGGLPFAIPGLSPEQQAQLGTAFQQSFQQGATLLQQILPGFQIPGMPTGTAPVQQPARTFNGFAVAGETPLADEDMREELLDIFGDEESFNGNRGQCFTPGMGVVFSDPQKGNVELMVSFACNQVQGNGFQWPYPVNGMTPTTFGKLRRIYEQMWGPLPQNGGV